MLVRDTREIALMICHSLIAPLLELPKMRLKYPRDPIADSLLHSSVQIIRQDVSEPEVGGHYARGPLKSPASAADLRLPLPSSDTLTRLVYNPNRETRKSKETRKGSMTRRWSTWWREE